MPRPGGGGNIITYGKIVIGSETAPLSEMQRVLAEILQRHGYPESKRIELTPIEDGTPLRESEFEEPFEPIDEITEEQPEPVPQFLIKARKKKKDDAEDAEQE